jgi:hypothetical protein
MTGGAKADAPDPPAPGLTPAFHGVVAPPSR